MRANVTEGLRLGSPQHFAARSQFANVVPREAANFGIGTLATS
jgi:hypothetical protein